MIYFHEKMIDDKILFKRGSELFFSHAKRMFKNDKKAYKEHFEHYKLEELHLGLVTVLYSKDFKNDAIKNRTTFRIDSILYIYIHDEDYDGDSDVVHKATYRYHLDENMNFIEDYLCATGI
jgi:hypothetical protein